MFKFQFLTVCIRAILSQIFKSNRKRQSSNEYKWARPFISKLLPKIQLKTLKPKAAYFIRILPPFFPIFCVVHSYRYVTNRSIKPDVEHLKIRTFTDKFALLLFCHSAFIKYAHLIFILLKWHRCSPFEISTNTARFESILQPAFGDGSGISAPFIVLTRPPFF